MSQSTKIAALGLIVGTLMDEILARFVPGSKITVLVRQPSHPDGTRDFVQTNDDLPAAIRALEISQRQGSTP